MKNSIILLLVLFCSFRCLATQNLESLQVEQQFLPDSLEVVDSLGCALAFEDTEILYGGVIVIHILTAIVDFYYCTYDPVSLQIEIYSTSETHYAGANSKVWTLKETFGVPTGGGLNYDCFLDEIEQRGLILP